MLSVVAEVDFRGTAGTLGYGTTVELVRAAARVPRGEARARVSAAADVLPGRGLIRIRSNTKTCPLGHANRAPDAGRRMQDTVAGEVVLAHHSIIAVASLVSE